MGDKTVDISLKKGFLGQQTIGFRKRSWHKHEPGQIIYVQKGSVRLQTQVKDKDHFWFLAPQQGIWIPPNLIHAAETVDETHASSVYIAKGLAKNLPKDVVSFYASNLLKELILESSRIDFSKASLSDKEERIFLCLLDQLQESKQNTLHFPLPSEPRLKKLVDILLADPGNKDSLSSLGKKVGASAKTLSRLLESEMKISFTNFRNSLRILHACKALQAKIPIVELSYALGFSSQAAFTTIFKKYMGTTPKHYADL